MNRPVPVDDLLSHAKNAADFSWHPAPVPLAMDHYDAAIEALLARARQIPSIVGAFDLGPVRFPGLSDIDLLFVLRDDALREPRLRDLRRDALPAAYHNVILHHPYFVRAGELPELFHFTPILALRERWSRGILQPPGVNNDPFDLTLTLLDTIAECYPHEFIRFLARPDLDERELAGRLKGLGYCIDLYARLIAPPLENWTLFAQNVQTLRAAFFETPLLDRRATILALTRDAVAVSSQLAWLTAEALGERWRVAFEGHLLLASSRVPACWVARLPARPLCGTVGFRRFAAFGQAPALLGWLAKEYASASGPVSGYIESRLLDFLKTDGTPPPEISAAIARRIALRNAHAAWIDGLNLGLYPFNAFGYLARERAGPVRRLRRMLGAARDRECERRLRKLLLESAAASMHDTQP